MTKAPQDAQEFYFVPFGRDRGGLLDVLQLPPDAPAGQVDSALGEYRKRLDSEMRAERKKHRKRKDDGEITPEEFSRIADEMMQRVDARSAELNRLKEPYDFLVAERRRLQQQGTFIRDEVLWQKMYPNVGDIVGLLQLLDGLNHGPLRHLSEAEVHERITAWLSAGKLLVTDTEGDSPGLAWAALGLVTEEAQDSDQIHDLFELVAQSFQEEIATGAHGQNGAEAKPPRQEDLDQAGRWIDQERQLLDSLLERIGSGPSRLFEELKISPDAPDPEVRTALVAQRAAVQKELDEMTAEQTEHVVRGETKPEAFEQWQQQCNSARAAWTTYFDGLLAGWERRLKLPKATAQDRGEPRAVDAINRLIADHQTAYSVLSDQSVISRLAELVRDSKLMTLLTADALWSALKGTNREHWRVELERALAAMRTNQIEGWKPEPTQPGPLSRPHDGYIAQLPWGEVEEASGPVRGVAFGREDVDFRDLLARLGTRGGIDRESGAEGRTPFEQLKARLASLLGNDSDDRPPP